LVIDGYFPLDDVYFTLVVSVNVVGEADLRTLKFRQRVEISRDRDSRCR
jgi:hypothetical protein